MWRPRSRRAASIPRARHLSCHCRTRSTAVRLNSMGSSCEVARLASSSFPRRRESSNHRVQLGFFGRAMSRRANGYWIPDQVGDDAENGVQTMRNNRKSRCFNSLSECRRAKPDSSGLDPAISGTCATAGDARVKPAHDEVVKSAPDVIRGPGPNASPVPSFTGSRLGGRDTSGTTSPSAARRCAPARPTARPSHRRPWSA